MPPPDKTRDCVNTADMKFGNDQIVAACRFDEKNGWIRIVGK